ncbi:MAG: DUF6748 domain-containing protein [Kofleriaceae bacterium]
MLRSTVICAVVTSSLIGACASDRSASEDELAGETDDDGETGKGDAVDAFTYFKLTPDTRECTPPACGGYYVERANRALLKCGNDMVKSCYVGEIAWETGMPSSMTTDFEQRLRGGEGLLLRGDVVNNPITRFLELSAKEIWVPASANGVAEGVFVLAKDNGIRCLTSPCPSITEIRLNSNRSTSITDLDLTPAGADEETIARAWQELGTAGLIVVGDRVFPENQGNGAKGRSANQFYLKAPVPLM